MDCPKRSAVDGLPEDSLVEILARVPTRSVYRSKCVAKGWRDLIEDPLHGNKIPQTLQGFFSIDEEIYGRGSRGGSGGVHIGFTSLRARSAPLGIDTRLSFLTELPGIKILTLVDSCNGLLLFEYAPKSEPYDRFGYIVCNPATKHWVSVPRYDGSPPPPYVRGETRYTYLVFDPVVSSHFHIVQFWLEFKKTVWFDDIVSDDDDEEEIDGEEREVYRISVHVYSSEIGTWSHIPGDLEEELEQFEGWRHQGLFPGKELIPLRGHGCAVLNGELHFIISYQEESYQDKIVTVDVQGETERTISLPSMFVKMTGYIAQSQGRLHYINQAPDAQILSIWVLEDTKKRGLKHSVSLVEMFGKRKCSGYSSEYRVVAMHPDGNVVSIVQNQKLISYDMDHKLVNVIAISENNISAKHIIPYVPCFLESPALTDKH